MMSASRPSSARDVLLAELGAVVRQLGDGEIRVLTRLAARMRLAQMRYGPIDSDDGERTPTQEAADALVAEALAALVSAVARCGT